MSKSKCKLIHPVFSPVLDCWDLLLLLLLIIVLVFCQSLNNTSVFQYTIAQPSSLSSSNLAIKLLLTDAIDLMISLSAIDSTLLSKVLTLEKAPLSSSSHHLLSSKLELIAVNSGNPPCINHFNLVPGCRIEQIIWNLTLPSSITFDDKNNMYIAEAGFVYGGLIPTPRILKVDNQSGTISVLVDRNLNGPITDIEFYEGKLFVSHRGVISTI